MDLLKREMERKKRALEQARQRKNKTTNTNNKYIKTVELRKYEEEGIVQKQQQEEQQPSSSSKEKNTSHRKRQRSESSLSPDEEEGQATKQLETTTADNSSTKDEVQQKKKKKTTKSNNKLTPEQVKNRLRQLRLPIRLFGENFEEQKNRLDDALQQQEDQMRIVNEADEYKLGSGHTIRNPFLEKDDDTTNKAAVLELEHAAKAASASSSKQEGNANKSRGDNKEDDDNNDKEGTKQQQEGSRKRDEKELLQKKNHDDDNDDPHKRVYKHFKSILKSWESDLNTRDDDAAKTLAGRNETKTYKQCKDYIRPLFKLCKNRTLDEAMLQHLVKMVEYSEQGEFVKANDEYMDVAIGRAAWPIGVTMVGIHARSGRAKIESSSIAHVMNSELTRKYLTSVKRLLSYHQKKRPDVDPSKKVL